MQGLLCARSGHKEVYLGRTPGQMGGCIYYHRRPLLGP